MIRSSSILAALLLIGNCLTGQFYLTGGYQGGGYASGGDKTLDVVVVDLRVLLQGAYRDGTMHCDLDSLGLIPLAQPFDSVAFYWHYAGTESVDSIPVDNVVDWIEVELRETSGGAAAATEDSVIGRRAGFLLKDGTVTDLDGTSELRFKYLMSNDHLYAVIKHRNHLAIMNSTPLTMTSEVYSYDFSTSQSKAYQDPAITGNTAMANLGGDKFGLWGGNAWADKYTKYNGLENDREAILNTVGATTPSKLIQGYSLSDVNMDTEVKYMGAGNDKVFIYNVLGGNEAKIMRSHVP
jgi:hypothetical protein